MAVTRIRGGIVAPEAVVDGTFYVSTPFDYNIYKVTKDSAQKIFQMVFPADRMLSGKVLQSQDMKFMDSVRNAIMLSQTLILDIQNIYLSKSTLFLKSRPLLM